MAEWIRKYYNSLYLFMQELLFLGICLFGLGSRMGVNEPLGVPLAAGAAAVLLFTGLVSLRTRERVFALLLLAGCFVTAGLTAGKEAAVFFVSYRHWLLGTGEWDPAWQSGYAAVQALLAAILCCLLGVLASRFSAVRTGIAGILFLLLLGSMLRDIQVSHVGAVLALWFCVMTVSENIRQHWGKKKEAQTALYMVWLMPFALLLLVLMLLMPSPPKAYDWNFVKAAYGRVRESVIAQIHRLAGSGREDFGLSFQGFSEEGELGGGLREAPEVLFEIKTDNGLWTNLYLAGTAYDRFDGRGWEKTCHETEPWQLYDTAETVSAVRADTENEFDFLRYSQLQITYGWFHTGYLFAPQKTRTVLDCDYENDGGDLRFGKRRGYGTSYRIDYYQLNAGTAGFYDFLESGLKNSAEARRQAALEKLLSDYSGQNRNAGKRELTLEGLERYRQAIKTYYGGAVTLSPEVRDWLDRVLTGTETELEKLRAIEYALASLEYTKTPGELPERVDDAEHFLDYFLLESGRGYCSYFATAFVLLARAEGIPARYVEGFCVPARQKKNVTVTSDMTHAWPEVWLEGFGWLPFEPTPGFLGLRYTPWKMSTEEEAADFAPPAGAALLSSGGRDTAPEENAEQPAETVPEEGSGMGAAAERILRVLPVSLAFLFCCMALALWADRRLRRRRYERMGTTERFLYITKQSFWLLSRLGLVREEAETLQEFQRRCEKTLGEGCFQTLTFLEWYRYGDREETEAALEIAVGERDRILERIRETGRLRWWLARFWLGG